MLQTIYEIHAVQKPIQKIQFRWDTLNLDNILTKTISKGLFQKTSLTLKMKTGETFIYESVDDKEMAELFRK